MKFLLVVTEDGYGKRIPVDEIVRTKGRDTVGVKVSNHPIPAALVVDRLDSDVVIATKAAKIERCRSPRYRSVGPPPARLARVRVQRAAQEVVLG
jgi:DNA gyrase/topoisomerase IV subunit A